MTTTDDLITLLHQIAWLNGKIHLLNVYKGIPIACEAMLSISPDSFLSVKTTPDQIVCLYHSRQTYLRHASLERLVSAQVAAIYPEDLTADLVYFHYVSSDIGKRKEVRVQPEETIPGSLFAPEAGMLSHAKLADISTDGLGLYVTFLDYSPHIYRLGAKLQVRLKIPRSRSNPEIKFNATPCPEDFLAEHNEAEKLSSVDFSSPSPASIDGIDNSWAPDPLLIIHAEVVNSRKEPDLSRFRVGLQIVPDDPSRTTLKAFIVQRQSEIIHEMQGIYYILTEPTK